MSPWASLSTQKLHFSTTPLVRVGYSGFTLLDERPRVPPVEAPGSVRTTGHTVPTSDAPVEIHHDDAILTPPCGPGGTKLHAGRIIALIAEEQNRAVMMRAFSEYSISCSGKTFS